jgi:hypothetical protein
MKKFTLVLVLFFTAFLAFAQTTRKVIDYKLVVYSYWNLEKDEFGGEFIRSLEFVNADAYALHLDDPYQTPEVIPEFCFRDNKLNILNIPVGVKRIERSAFEHSIIIELSLPEGLEYIGPNAFSNNFIETIKLPKSLKYLDLTAFSGNYSPTKIWIGDNVEIADIPYNSSNGFYHAYKENNYKAGWYKNLETQRIHEDGWKDPYLQWGYIEE